MLLPKPIIVYFAQKSRAAKLEKRLDNEAQSTGIQMQEISQTQNTSSRPTETRASKITVSNAEDEQKLGLLNESIESLDGHKSNEDTNLSHKARQTTTTIQTPRETVVSADVDFADHMSLKASQTLR
jgi:hypothetical protein